jgi:chromosome segregation ATPase
VRTPARPIAPARPWLDDGGVTPTPQGPDEQRHPTRKWIVATVVLLVAVVGLGAYALSLRSDAEDKDAQIASQQQQLEEQQGVADDVQDAAASVAEEAQQAFGELGDQIDELSAEAEATQEETQQAIEDAEQAAADAEARAESAQDDVEEANARADEAEAQAQTVGACARGYLSAIGSAFGAGSVEEGVDQAKSEIEALNSSCRDALAAGG